MARLQSEKRDQKYKFNFFPFVNGEIVEDYRRNYNLILKKEMKEVLAKGIPTKFVVAQKPNPREIAKLEASDPEFQEFLSQLRVGKPIVNLK